MKTKFAIIGGGIAGLCAAVRLSELGEQPVVIEGGAYPTHKICGEFLSPESIHVLSDWDIHPIPIAKVLFKTSKNCLSFPFPSSAGGMSHIQLAPALVERASAGGAHIKTNTHVNTFHPKQHLKDLHRIELSTGETIEASHVIIATGRIPNYSVKAPLMSYMGFKTHFKDISSEENLEMFSLPGAYLGISPIGNHHYNVACLASLDNVKKESSPQAFIDGLISQNRELHDRLSQGKNLFDQWMVTSIPSFGVKETPAWLDTYFIGDASATIPPACGDGLSMAIFGGRLAAEYSVQQQFQEFKQRWTKQCASQIFWAKFLHRLMLNPAYVDVLMPLARQFPCLCRKMFEWTRMKEFMPTL